MSLAVLKGFPQNTDVFIKSVPFTIGRNQSASFIILNVNISRHHCAIVFENSQWKVCDSSSSGTFVNDSLIGKNQSVNLKQGDVIRLGPVVENSISCTFYSLIPENFQFDSSETQTSLNLCNRFENVDNCMRQIRIMEKGNEMNVTAETNNYKNTDEKLNEPLSVNLMSNENDKSFTKCKEISTENIDKTYCFLSYVDCLNLKKKLMDCENVQTILNDLKLKNLNLMEKLSSATSKCNEALSLKSEATEKFTELVELELQCTICSELFVNAVTLGCSHSFCKLCLKQWKNKQKTCPICRKKISVEAKSIVLDNYIDKIIDLLPSEIREKRKDLIQEHEIKLSSFRSWKKRKL